jgi:DNA-binding response OmpR family regulator
MKKHILLVEDDSELANALAEYLGSKDFGVVVVASIKDAWNKLKNQAFFAVITDVRLENESGEDLIEQIRSAPDKSLNQRVPIVVISAFLDRALAERLQSQINGAFVKPFEMEPLLAKLESFGPPA